MGKEQYLNKEVVEKKQEGLQSLQDNIKKSQTFDNSTQQMYIAKLEDEKRKDTRKEKLSQQRDITVNSQSGLLEVKGATADENAQFKQSIVENRQTEILSPQALKKRNELVESKRLEIKSFAIKQDNKTAQLRKEADLKKLDSIIAIKKERRDPAKSAKRVKKMWEVIEEHKKFMRKDTVTTPENKLTMLYNLFKVYKEEFDTFENKYFPGLNTGGIRQKSLGQGIDKYKTFIETYEKGLDKEGKLSIEARDKLLKQTKLDVNIELCHEQLEENAIKNAYEVEGKKNADKKQQASQLSEKKLAAVHEVDKWLFTHSVSDKISHQFISKLLSLQAHERLFIYMIIEQGRVNKASEADMILSQIDYTPDLSKFKEKMSAGLVSSVLKHFSTDHIHWTKVEEAMQILDTNREKIESYSKLGDLEETLEKVDSKEKRGKAFKRAIFNLKQYIERAKIIEKDPKVYENMAVAARLTPKELKNSSKEIKDAADLAKSQSAGWSIIVNDLKTAFEGPSDKNEEIKQAPSKTLAGVRPEMTTSQKVMSSVGMTAKYGGMSLGQETFASKILNYSVYNTFEQFKDQTIANGSFLSSLGAISLMGAVLGITHHIQDSSNMTALAHLQSVLQEANAVMGLATVTNSAALMFSNAANIANSQVGNFAALGKEGGQALLKMQKVSRIMGYTTNGISAAVNIVEHVSHKKDISHMTKANTSLERRWEAKAGQKGAARDEHYEKNFIKLEKRINGQKTFGAFQNSTRVGLGFASIATMTVPLVGLILGSVSFATVMAGEGWSTFKKIEKRHHSIEDFLNIDKFIEEAKLDNLSKHDLKDLKENLIKKMMAELGFANEKTFYSHILQKYAMHLNMKLFRSKGLPIYKDKKIKGGPKYFVQKPGEKAPIEVPYEELEPYIELAKGLGLKVRYPHSPEEAKEDDRLQNKAKRRPQIGSIIAKLM